MLLFLIGGLVKLAEREAFYLHWEIFLGILRNDDPGVFESIRIHWTVFGPLSTGQRQTVREKSLPMSNRTLDGLVTSSSVDISHLTRWPPFFATSCIKIEIKSKNWTLWLSTSRLLLGRWCWEMSPLACRKTPEIEMEALLKRYYTKVQYFVGTVMNVADLHRVQVGNTQRMTRLFYSP